MVSFLAVIVALGAGPEQPQIYTTSYPLAYVADRLAGTATFPAPKDEDPAFWRPAPEVVRRYQRADLILLNGAGYEKWVATTSLPLSKIVNTAAGFTNEWLRMPATVTHSHGPGGAHSHGDIDFNTWLDPILFARQTEAVEMALRRVVTEAELRKRGEQLRGDLKKLDEEFRKLSVPALLASHPVYNYLAKRYRWDLQSVHWEPGEEVTAAQWTEFDALRAKHPAAVMLWEGEPLPAVRAELEKRGVRVVVFETGGNTPPTGDYLATMQRNVAALRAATR